MNPFKEYLKSLKILEPVIMARRKYLDWAEKRRPNIDQSLRAALDKKENLFIVQIGSNDGLTADPLHALLQENPSWQALFVEPVPYLFARLRKNYGDHPRFRFENVAISEKAGNMPFYYLSENARKQAPDLPEWYEGIGSFNRQNLPMEDPLAAFVQTINVETLTLDALFKRQEISKVDLLHLDTESHDWIILRQFDLKQYAPTVILFEHKLLSAKAKSEAVSFLRNKYVITRYIDDYFCHRKRPFFSFKRAGP